MQTVVNLIKYVLACVPFALLLLGVRALNLKKIKRGRQVIMPVVTLLYCAAVAIFVLWLNNKLRRITGSSLVDAWAGNNQSDYISTLLSSTALSNYAATASAALSAVLQVVIKYLVIIINTLAAVLYLVLKAICLPILSGIWKEGSHLYSATAGLFYDYDEDNSAWLLQERWHDFRKLLKALYLGAFIVAVLLMAAAQLYSGKPAFQAILFPSFGALIIGEIAFVLDGYTGSEYEENILGESAKTRRMLNLAKLREPLKQLFGDRLLIEGTSIAAGAKQGVTDTLEAMSVSDDPRDRIAAEYFQILRGEGTALDVDSITSATNILKGKSVLFCNPFYKDLTHYFMLPVQNTLMGRKKCLVIAGRKSAESEIRAWMADAVEDYLKMTGLWKIGSIADNDDYDIGILTFSQLYDLKMLHARREFFHGVGLVIILEPSMILATGQLGLSLVVNYCDESGDQPQYCMCDRNCDGLVDSLSHLIKQSITNVAATDVPTAMHSELGWHSDGEYLHQRILPDISRYLGVGTELAAASVKEQIPYIVWRSDKKFPVVDMKWIVGQYYGNICRYANLPMSQEAVYNAIGFEADIWGTEKETGSCVIVEDEFSNLLEMVRLFSTRGDEQSFVQVISENYMLRDYMQDNYRIFSADQKAIPTIVADYARTERNTAMRIIMLLLMNESVPEDVIRKELRLVGIQRDDLCAAVNDLIRKYTLAAPVVVPVIYDSLTGKEIDSGDESALQINERDKAQFSADIGNVFQNAYYITEDDKEASSFMDAKLLGHIYQTVLPGQFFTYDGKYYEIRSITAAKGVMVRRAADHIVGRKYYRQKRSYYIDTCDEAGARSRTINGMEVSTCKCSVIVETGGYFEFSESNNIRTAKEVKIAESDGDGSEYLEYIRNYKYKNVLRIKLPGADEAVRYTLCLLLNEAFHTVYADTWQYLAAVTPQTDETKNALRGILYSVGGSYIEASGDQDCIYIIEDSDVDMGLLESVDRNLTRLMSIVTDYLDWHKEKMTTPDIAEPEAVEITLPTEEKTGFFAKLKKLFKRIIAFFKRIFHIGTGKKKDKKKSAQNDEVTAQPAPSSAAETPAETTDSEESESSEAETAGSEPAASDAEAAETAEEASPAEPELTEKTDDAEFENVSEPEAEPEPETKPVLDIGEEIGAVKNKYQTHCFLLFGYDEIDPAIAVDATLDFLNQRGFGENELHQARKHSGHAAFDSGKAEQQCDFCGLPLNGVAYDVLSDGRVRCVRCSGSAVDTLEEFTSIYKRVLMSMEALYDIRVNAPIRVRTADAYTIAKHSGAVYKPTNGFDARVVGFARLDKTGYSLYVENGAPRLAAMETIAHELTHIWQYLNWNSKTIESKYGKGNRDLVYEGMAVWAAIQFLYLIGENDFAMGKEQAMLEREDVYGQGFRYYCLKYPLSRSMALPQSTPFHAQQPL